MAKRRYGIVFMVFLVIFINYMDRVNFAVSIPAIRARFGFSLDNIGAISFAWAIVYALFNFPGGWIADRLGLRWGLSTALGWWSVFTIATPLAGGMASWMVVRGLMGAGEAPIWSFNAKTARSWAAPSERSTAYTLAGSGQYLGPAVGTLLSGWIVVDFGWEWTFYLFGLAGLILVPVWFVVVRDSPARDPRITPEERAWIGNEAQALEGPDWPGIRAVILSRTGLGVLLTYLTFGYILFTFLNWVPSYMYYTFHMDVLRSAAWSSLGALMGFLGFVLSGPFNDRLVRRYDRLTARRIGASVPMVGVAVCIIVSLFSARAESAWATAILIGAAQLMMNLTVGAWAVNVIDISPNQASTGIVYGFYNGILNVMGALNSLILTWIAARFGFPLAFGSAILFMLVFLIGILFVIDRRSYADLIATASKRHAVEA